MTNTCDSEKGEMTMAVSAGVLYEVNGLAARKMIQELDHPTGEQIEKRQEVQQVVKECANFIRMMIK